MRSFVRDSVLPSRCSLIVSLLASLLATGGCATRDLIVECEVDAECPSGDLCVEGACQRQADAGSDGVSDDDAGGEGECLDCDAGDDTDPGSSCDGGACPTPDCAAGDTRACGACGSGSQTCSGAGQWGVCVGDSCTPSSVCGNGSVEAGEDCESGPCCDSQCRFKAASLTCRPAAGACDLAERCTGASPNCPSDRFASVGTSCESTYGPATCSGTASECPATTTKVNTTYILIPHPDDEYEAWSLIEGASGNYPVFILLTHGEQSGYCEPSGQSAFQPQYGEMDPQSPWTGRWTAACEAARLRSWHAFLDAMAAADSTLPKAPPRLGAFTLSGTTPQRTDSGAPYLSNKVEVFRNSVGARVVFNLGDGDLSAAEVLWALRAVRSNRASWGLPQLPEYAAIGASFWNQNYPNCAVYTHADHRAVHDALWNNKLLTNQWVRTCDADPDVANGGRTKLVTSATHAYGWAATATSRDGKAQWAYGWLTNGPWAAAEEGDLMSRKQSFWRK